jgi:predicted RecB family nuclease
MSNAFGSYIAKQCRYALHLDALPASVQPSPRPADPVEALRARMGAEFEEQIGEILTESHPDLVHVRGDNSVAQTTAAMDAGALLIWNASLPEDVVNRRTGKPDLLVRFGDAPQAGNWRYVPVDVKSHDPYDVRSTDRKTVVLGSLETMSINEGEVVNAVAKNDDQLQLSHYWCMLDSLNRAPQDADPMGGIIGRVELASLLIWVPLDISDYLDKFTHALTVIDHATTVTASPLTDTSARSYPHTECSSCHWFSVCDQQWQGRDDIGLAVPDALAEKLKKEGVTTRTQLAKLDLAAIPPNQSTRIDGVLKARAQIGNRAVIRPTANDHYFRFPSSNIEIDVDMEDFTTHCYLWGTYTTIKSANTPRNLVEGYRAFTAFESDGKTFAEASDTNEAETFIKFWRWVKELIRDCDQLETTITFYCYTGAENRWLRSIAKRYAGKPGIPSIDEIEAFITSQYWVDVHFGVKTLWVTGTGAGLKSIAPIVGRHWDDENDGGAQSLLWFDDATRSTDPAVRLERSQKLLRYNENDVLATKRIRDYLRSNWPFAEVEPPTLP